MTRKMAAVLSQFEPALFAYIRKNGYSAGAFFKDFSAGITLGVVALPLALAFAIASGLTPDRGLYTVVGGALIMALLSGSRFQVCGPTGAFVVIIYNIVERHGYEGLVVATLMAGIMLVIFGFFRMGGLVKFIPYPVTTGFTAGIALLIFTSQMKDFFGLPLAQTPPEFFDKWKVYGQEAMAFSPSTVGIAMLTLVILVAVRKKMPRFPAPIVGVVLSSFTVMLFNLPVETIGSKFGAMPSSLPSFVIPTGISFEMVRALLPDAITIALLAGIESLLSCVVADSMTGTRHNSNAELVSQGVGNIVSVFFGGFAATGAIARTATNVRSGAVTPISAIIHTLAVAAFILWLSPLGSYIPLASLAAVLVYMSWGMFDAHSVLGLLRGPKSDWSVMVLTMVLTVVLDLTVAVYMGVVFSSLFFMRRMSSLTEINSTSGEEQELALHEDIPLAGEYVPKNVQIFSINGPFFFGVADRFLSTLETIDRPVKVFILYLHHMPVIDATAMHALESFLDRRSTGCLIFLADVRPGTMHLLDRMGLIRRLGKENVFPTLHAALERARDVVGE